VLLELFEWPPPLAGGDVSPRQCIFIHDFPSHPLSSWLKNNIPNSEKWSAKTRRLVAAKIQAFDLDCVSALNAMLLNSLNTITGVWIMPRRKTSC
jgi:hypothetical protein